MLFPQKLELEWIDGRFWRITAPFDYDVGPVDDKEVVHVPVGFVTDFASIPKIFWNILPPTSWYGLAAVIHDLLYKIGQVDGKPITRKYADKVLNEAMEVLYPTPSHFKYVIQRLIIYYGVRIGGWLTWNAYRKAELVCSVLNQPSLSPSLPSLPPVEPPSPPTPLLPSPQLPTSALESKKVQEPS